MITTAFIHLWDKRVGAIAWDANTRLASFEYDPAFLNHHWNIAPLTMPIIGASGKVFSFPELRGTATFKGLPGMLADVLPDRYGNSLINAWLAKNGRPADSMNPVELLCFIGKRGMGALEFEPVLPKSNAGATKIELENLIQVAQKILSGRQDFATHFSGEEEKALSDILKMGTSAGGARAKAVITYNERTGEIRSGQADAPKGFTHWLLKFDGISDSQLGTTHGYGRVEMAYYRMALDCGIQMMESRLLEENDRAHFFTRRFDRDPVNGKLHVQSFCALRHFDFNEINAYSYEQLFETMRMMRLPYTDAEQLFRRMVFNVLARNCDDHTKNFSFIMAQDGIWKLAPAFDICHAYRPGSIWVNQHSLSINGKRQNITRYDLLQVAQKMNIKKADAIINQVQEAVSKWDEFAIQTKVKKDLKEAIAKTLLLL
jgi:serine/threonine-protein kinase HipA